jgi:predicted membrane protein
MDDQKMYDKLEEVHSRVTEVALSVAKMEAVVLQSKDHEQRIKKVETWQARLIGAWTAGALILGIAFQVMWRTLMLL